MDTNTQTNQKTPKITRFDVVGSIINYENGDLDDAGVIDLFQHHLVDNGLAWQLQGAYGRMAQRLINQGLMKHD